ncbi:hypothetical protein diail_4677 [Diaporthe ilicicola]|nr:hypothetical protein diail_4677 [Diaporthe ilicicola]
MAKSADIDPLLTEEDISPAKGWYLGTLWAETRKEIRHDLKSTRWRHTAAFYFPWFLFCCWALGVFALCLVFPLYITGTVSSSLDSSNWNYCAPDGSFSLNPINLWNPGWTFQIVLGFGSLNFTQAKVVDVVWDIGVGRLGQSLLACFSWKAFSVYVRASMETNPITYRTFWTTFMQREPSLQSITRLIRDFASKRGLRSKVAMAFMVITMLFVMAFPTLASAMTGYTANNEAVIKMQDGTQTPFGDFRQLTAIIHDGSRVGLEADYKVFKNSKPTQYQTCGGVNCIESYIYRYGNVSDTKSTWQQPNHDDIKLPSPTLNISYWSGKESNVTFLYGSKNDSYTLDYIQQNAVCQPVMFSSQQTYQWGFSVVQLEISLVLLVVWTFGVWVMWLHGHLELANRGKYEVPKDFKAALYLADSIRKDLDEFGQEPEFLSNEDLKRHAAEHLKGGKVEIQTLSLNQGYSFRRHSWQWIKNNKLWILGFLFVSGTCVLCYGNVFPILTMTFALAAGWGSKTRAVVSWAAFFVGVAIFWGIMAAIGNTRY